MPIRFIILLILTIVVTKLGTELYSVFAWRFAFVDRPDHHRKLQKKPVPVGGGAVIWLVLAAVFCLFERSSAVNFSHSYSIPAAALGSFVLVTVGLYDDKYGMRGERKLFFQLFVSTLVICFAKPCSNISILGRSCELGFLIYPAAIFWLVGLINSINLLDGADGVLSSLGFLMLSAAAGIGLINGHDGVFRFALIAAAALAGFFFCNRPPAKVYLGDTGSMLIGLLLGILLLRALETKDQTFEALPAICVVFIPILDSVFAVIRRKNERRSIFSSDRGHIHHRFQKRFGGGNILILSLSALQIPLSLAAVAGVCCRNDLIPLGTMFFFFLLLTTTGIFGRDETLALAARLNYWGKKRFYRIEYNNKGLAFCAEGTVKGETALGPVSFSTEKNTAVSAFSDDFTSPPGEDSPPLRSVWSNISKPLTDSILPLSRPQLFRGIPPSSFDVGSIPPIRSPDGGFILLNFGRQEIYRMTSPNDRPTPEGRFG